MTNWIRYRSGPPTIGDFSNSSGAPIVIDSDTGIVYILVNNVIHEIPSTPVSP